MGRNKYTAPKRSMWFIFRTLLTVLVVLLLAFGALVTAMYLSNMYILATEGMALRAECIVQDGSMLELNEYFTADFINSDPALSDGAYSNFNIKDYNYSLSIEGAFVLPFSNSGRMRVVEKVTNVSGALNDTAAAEGAPSTLPEWTPERIDILFTRVDGRWYISGLKVIEQNPVEAVKGTPDLSLLEETP